MIDLQDNELAHATSEVLRTQREIIARLNADITRLRTELLAAQETAKELIAENRDLGCDLALCQPRHFDREPIEFKDMATMRRAIATRLRSSGVSLRVIGSALGVDEKTIRNWTSEKVEA